MLVQERKLRREIFTSLRIFIRGINYIRSHPNILSNR